MITARIHPGIAVLAVVAGLAAALLILQSVNHKSTATTPAPAALADQSPWTPTAQPPATQTPTAQPPSSIARVSVAGIPQSSTHASDISKMTAPTIAPATSSEANGFSDHGPGRVACEGPWIALHKAASGYRDFMVNCMKNRHASDISKMTAPTTAPATSSEANGFSDHGPGRVACEGQWIALHRNDYEKAASYPDFMVNCMKKKDLMKRATVRYLLRRILIVSGPVILLAPASDSRNAATVFCNA